MGRGARLINLVVLIKGLSWFKDANVSAISTEKMIRFFAFSSVVRASESKDLFQNSWLLGGFYSPQNLIFDKFIVLCYITRRTLQTLQRIQLN